MRQLPNRLRQRLRGGVYARDENCAICHAGRMPLPFWLFLSFQFHGLRLLLPYKIYLERIPQLESSKSLSDKTCEEIHYAVIRFHQDFPIKAQANHIDLGNDAPPKIMASDIVVKQLGVLRMVTACRFLRKHFSGSSSA